eukprot:TRINITY_DN7772_c0_g1_i1.p1 TRINITY_DN7772_c0_g1~~TRINITY_DN7772_c0_g1_i1.p1  ORF type:complete len:339 (+),score=87.72 TRINITY_DN7772_c0_g1_i1:117-1019(+)
MANVWGAEPLPPKKPEEFQKIVTTEGEFQKEMLSAKAQDHILLVELFSKWCGPCHILKPALEAMLAEKVLGCKVRVLALDIDRVIRELRVRSTEIDWSRGDDDTVPARWSRILLPWVGTIEPTFLYFRRGKLCSITEGLNLPQLEFHLEWMSQPNIDVSTIRIGITQKEINAAAFTIQSRWRRKKQLQRIGVYVNGVFKTHEEVRLEHEQALAEERRRKKEEEYHRAALLIQKHIRGFLARKWVHAHKRQMIQKHRQMRKAAASKAAKAKEAEAARRGTQHTQGTTNTGGRSAGITSAQS